MWGCEDVRIWEYGDVKMCGFGNVRIWECGDLNLLNIERKAIEREALNL